MLSGRRFRVRLTPDQLAYAEQVAGDCRAVWNTGLDQRRQYRQRRAWINYPEQCRRTPNQAGRGGARAPWPSDQELGARRTPSFRAGVSAQEGDCRC